MRTIINASGIGKSFAKKQVLREASLRIVEGDKIGLVGQNGSGKTTLLNILAESEEADVGEIKTIPNLKIGYLTQDHGLNEKNTVLEELTSPTGFVGKLGEEIKKVEKRMEDPSIYESDEYKSVVSRYNELLEEFKKGQGYGYKEKVMDVVEVLGIDETSFNLKLSALSGGEKTKINLAKILVQAQGADLLLLDEPTNHLDIDTTEWLEQFISSYRGTVVIVSHDRYFLDRTVENIFEIENKAIKEYKGNYSEYKKKKEKETAIHALQYRKQRKEIKRIEESIETIHRQNWFGSRFKSHQKMLDRMEKIEKPRNRTQKMSISFGAEHKSGVNILTVNNLTKKFGDFTLLDSISFEVEKDDKIGLIGPNGCGKTTLLKIITSQTEKTSGKAELTPGVKMGYYDQEHEDIDADKTVEEEIKALKPKISEKDLRNFLARFLFRGRDIYSNIGTLSGGERARLALSKLVLEGNNFLVLDEPTNYLDIESKHAAEAALREYPGAIFVVSHDRFFLDEVINKIIELESGKITIYPGNYTEYKEAKRSGKVRRPEHTTASGGRYRYEVRKSYKDWVSGKRYQRGDIIYIHPDELKNHEWALKTGAIVKMKNRDLTET